MLNGLEHNFLLHQRTPTSCLLRKDLSPCASRNALKRVKRSHLPLALIFLVYQEIIRLRLLHPRRPRCSYLGRNNHGWNHCEKKVYRENKKATSTMVSPVIILSRLAAPGSQRMGETKILSLGIPPPPKKKKKVKKKWTLGDDGFNLLSPQSTDKVPEFGDEKSSLNWFSTSNW